MPCCADHWFPTENDPPVSDETSIADLPGHRIAASGADGPVPGHRIQSDRPAGVRQTGEAEQAMVHAITLHAAGTVSYRNRWITTDAAAQALGTEPVPGPPPGDIDVVASNIITFGSTILALGDGALAYELTAELATRRRVDLAGAGRGLRPRVHLDRQTGALHLLGVRSGHRTDLRDRLGGSDDPHDPAPRRRAEGR